MREVLLSDTWCVAGQRLSHWDWNYSTTSLVSGCITFASHKDFRKKESYFLFFGWRVCSVSPPSRLLWTTFSTTCLTSLLLSFPRLGGHIDDSFSRHSNSHLNHFKIIALRRFQVSAIGRKQMSLQRKKCLADKRLNLIPFQAPIADCVSSYMYPKILSFLREVFSVFQPFHRRLEAFRHF